MLLFLILCSCVLLNAFFLFRCPCFITEVLLNIVYILALQRARYNGQEVSAGISVTRNGST